MPTYTQYRRGGEAQDISEIFNADVLAFDAETTSLNNGKMIPVGVSVASRGDSAFYFHKDYSEGLLHLSDPDKVLIAHNGKYDRSALKKIGYKIDHVIDTLLGAHLLEIRPTDLKTCTEGLLNYKLVEFGELGAPVQALSFEEQAKYSCPHAYSTFALWDYIYPRLKQKGLLRAFNIVETPLIPVLSDMELTGCLVSQSKLEEIGKIIDENVSAVEGALRQMTHEPTLNFNSPDQAADLFYNKLNIKPPWQHTEKRPSVEAKYLEPMANKNPIIKLYLEYKGYQKLKGTYVDGLIKNMVNGRIYGNFNQDGTDTSRLSASKPNLQNIPARDELGRQIREAWVARPGCKIVKADASQLELRMIAHWSQDERMLDAFRHDRDIHLETTMLIFNDAKRRSEGKTANFQIVYGGGAKKNRDLLEQAYPRVFEWIKQASFDAVEAGGARTLFGRNRRIHELEDERPWMVEHGMRMAISTHIQGCLPSGSKILVKDVGYVNIESQVNNDISVWDGTRYVKAHVVYSGKKHIVMTELDNGQKLYSSANHKFKIFGARSWQKRFLNPANFYFNTPLQTTNEIEDPEGKISFDNVESRGTWNAKDLSFRDIPDDFDLGVILGRLASDGNINPEHSVIWIVAEHEYDVVLPYLKDKLSAFGYIGIDTQQKKNQQITRLIVNSRALAIQADRLSICKRIPQQVYANKNILKGFLCGMFDGDAGFSDKSFGLKQGIDNFDFMRDIQEALLLFGIKSRLHIYDLGVSRLDIVNQNDFRIRIGLINPKKANKLIYDMKNIPGGLDKCELTVNSINSNIAVDMYDVVNSETHQFMTGGIVTHNSSAEVMKIMMRKVWEKMHDTDIEMNLQVHDELVFTVPIPIVDDFCQLLYKTMRYDELSLPFVVEVKVGDNWGSMKTVKEFKT